MESSKPYDLVLVPFPFTDRATQKRRPALVLSSENFLADSGHLLCAMITSTKRSSWRSDTAIADWSAAGLPVPSKVRMKLFTLDERLLIKKLGSLSRKDARSVNTSLKRVLG